MAPINKTFFGNFMGTYFISRQASHFQGPAGKMKMRKKNQFSLFFSFCCYSRKSIFLIQLILKNIKPTLWPENRIQIDSLDSHQHGKKIMGLDEITQSIL